MYSLAWMHGNGKTILYLCDWIFKGKYAGPRTSENKEEARKFNTPMEAALHYLNLHAFPNDYIDSLKSGSVLIFDEAGNIIHPGLFI